MANFATQSNIVEKWGGMTGNLRDEKHRHDRRRRADRTKLFKSFPTLVHSAKSTKCEPRYAPSQVVLP